MSLNLVPDLVFNNRKELVTPSLVAMIFFAIFMQVMDLGYKNELVPMGQVTLQFSFTEKNTRAMFTSFY